MNLEERLGELLLVGFPGESMNESLAAHIRSLRPAGLIFFRRNIVSPGQLVRLTRDIQNLALDELGRPLLLAADQEGGSVARLPSPFSQFPDPPVLAEIGPQEVKRQAALTAREMLLVGLNLNLAPVVDVNALGADGPMSRRSFGGDPAVVASCGQAVVRATQGEGIIATAKHFPGLGRARRDPHHELPVVDAGREEIRRCDLLPFQAAIRAGVECVMTSHILYANLDPELPGTFSSAILRGLLRKELAFQGLILTDDLEMGAVTLKYSLEWATVAALRAGADLLLVCSDMDGMHLAAEALRFGLKKGLLEADRLARSLLRLERLRNNYLEPFGLPDIDAVSSYFSSSSC